MFGQGDLRAERSIDQQVVAVSAGGDSGEAGDKLIGCEAAAGERERKVVHAVSAGQIERGLDGVTDNDHAAAPFGELVLRVFVQVRVIPIGAGVVIDLEGGPPCGSSGDDLMRSAVHDGGDVEAVPMRRGGFGEIVGDVELHPIAFVHDERGAPHQHVVIGNRGGVGGVLKHGVPKTFRGRVEVQIERRAGDDFGNNERVVGLRGGEGDVDGRCCGDVARGVVGDGGDAVGAVAERHGDTPVGEAVRRCRSDAVHGDVADSREPIGTRATDGDGSRHGGKR